VEQAGEEGRYSYRFIAESPVRTIEAETQQTCGTDYRDGVADKGVVVHAVVMVVVAMFAQTPRRDNQSCKMFEGFPN
jgi:hypothetical protein